VNEFFRYRGGQLHAENVPVEQIAAAVGTPVYVYSAASFVEQYRALAAALAPVDPLICYALKANSNQAVLTLFARLGAGADVVSEGELRRALAAGVPAERIVFSGVGKTRAELAAALDAGIHQINVESVPELRALSELASSRGQIARVAIRVNPDVDAGTHTAIATGRKGDKFGIAHTEIPAAYRLAAQLPGLDPVGLAVHIGSQIVKLAPSRAAFSRVAELVATLRGEGHSVPRVDLGGGLTIPYHEDDPEPVSPASYAALVQEIFSPLDVALAFEPGRFLVGAGGVLVTGVVYVKEGEQRIVVLDAAMNDLVRPAMYAIEHRIVPVREPPAGVRLEPADIVGPVCESTDTFNRGYRLPRLEEGDLVAFTAAGAYGAVMSSTYNSRPLVPEVLVHGGRFAVIRERPSYEAMLALDTIPDWLGDPAEAPRRRGAA
jgi:diaminopimelate decarboxylase